MDTMTWAALDVHARSTAAAAVDSRSGELIRVDVIAPGKTPRVAAERIKTDRRDAELLVRQLMAGALCAIHVPTPALEAARDLVRAREDIRCDLSRARHRVSKLLLRHGQVYPKDR